MCQFDNVLIRKKSEGRSWKSEIKTKIINCTLLINLKADSRNRIDNENK